MKYQVNPAHQRRAGLIQVVEGKAVNLLGKELKKEVPAADQFGVPTTKLIPGATQEDLKKVYELGTKDVEGRLVVVAVAEAKPAVKAK